MAKIKSDEFWITNISTRNVSLMDLRFTIPARTHRNLLDSRHFNFTPEQLQKSADSGSLFTKRSMIKVRKVAPEIIVKPGLYVSKAPLFLTEHPELSQVVIKEEHYEELQVSDEDFAEEMTKDEK